MNRTIKRPLFIMLAIYIIDIISVTIICLTNLNNKTFVSSVITIGVFSLFLVTFVFLIILFRLNLEKSIYQYSNIIYITAILYIFIQLISFMFFIFKCIANKNPLNLRSFINTIVNLPSQFSYWGVIVLVIISICITVSNISLIIHEGFRLKNLLGIIFGLLYVGGTYAIYTLLAHLYLLIINTGNMAQSQLIMTAYSVFQLFVLFMLCYFECVFFGFSIMSYIAVKVDPSYDKDFIIILGCSIGKQGGLLPLLKGRTNKAIRFAWDQEIQTGKPVKYIPSGGQGTDEVMSEGSAIELYLLSHGAEQYEVLAEKKSRNTYENFKYSYEIIKNSGCDNPRVAFATTNFHEFRSGMIARNAGIEAEGIASKTKWYFWPNGFIREYFAILSMNKKGHVIMTLVNLIICISLYLLSTVIN